MALGKSLSVVRSSLPPPHESQRLCSSEVWLPQWSCNVLLLTKLRRPFHSVSVLVCWGTPSATSCWWICTALAVIWALWAALAVMQSRTLDWWGCAEFRWLNRASPCLACLAITGRFSGACVRILCWINVKKFLLQAWHGHECWQPLEFPAYLSHQTLQQWGDHLLRVVSTSWCCTAMMIFFGWLWKRLYFPLKSCSREKHWLFCGRQENHTYHCN